MKQFFYNIILLLLLFSSLHNCAKEENKEVYNVIKEKGALIQNSSRSGENNLLEAIKREPNNYNALVQLGNLYFDNGMHLKSIEMYQKALKINPRDSNVRTDMGVMFREIKDYDRAIKEFRQSASDNPGHLQSRVNLGISLLYDKGDGKGAIEAFESVLKINPNYPDAERVRKLIGDAKTALQTQPTKSNLPKSKSSEGWIK